MEEGRLRKEVEETGPWLMVEWESAVQEAAQKRRRRWSGGRTLWVRDKSKGQITQRGSQWGWTHGKAMRSALRKSPLSPGGCPGWSLPAGL